MEHRSWPRLQCRGGVDWGLSYHTPGRTESWETPKGINGSLNAAPTTRLPAVLPAEWRAEGTGNDDANGCPCHPGPQEGTSDS